MLQTLLSLVSSFFVRRKAAFESKQKRDQIALNLRTAGHDAFQNTANNEPVGTSTAGKVTVSLYCDNSSWAGVDRYYVGYHERLVIKVDGVDMTLTDGPWLDVAVSGSAELARTFQAAQKAKRDAIVAKASAQ